jgi:glutaconate CoA-transferase subunit B
MERHERAFLIATIARLLAGRRHIAVGANLPIPAAAALLARRQSGGTLRVDILGSRRHDAFPGLGGLWDFASQGRYDGFFLSPGQVDGAGNINLVGIGAYPRLDVRWPGSHGSPLLYMMIPGIILFHEVHRKRALVERVDFISATGTSPPNVHRPGGPGALVTNLGCFAFDRTKARFRLESIHPGATLQQIVDNTGFAFDTAHTMQVTPQPDADTLALIGNDVAADIAEIYPRFAQSLAAGVAAASAVRTVTDSAPSTRT